MNTLYLEVSVRVKPEADKNFVEQFTKDMQNQLEVGHYFLTSVTPFEKDRENYLNLMGLSGNFKSIFAISTFLFINIFLAVVGTFWLRTQSRRGEIGLRVAMGASQKSIQKMFIGETILLLFLASIVAAVICINVTMVDVLKDIGVPVIDRSEAPGMSQYLINYGITFLFLALIAVIAVWYPAQKASKIQPAEALHDE
jgi:putative ABC transport system permease protein